MEHLFKNRLKLKICSKIENLFKNRNFIQKSKISSNIENLFKNRKFLQKSKKKFKNLNFVQKLIKCLKFFSNSIIFFHPVFRQMFTAQINCIKNYGRRLRTGCIRHNPIKLRTWKKNIFFRNFKFF